MNITAFIFTLSTVSSNIDFLIYFLLVEVAYASCWGFLIYFLSMSMKLTSHDLSTVLLKVYTQR